MTSIEQANNFSGSARCEVACGTISLGLITMFVLGILGATKVIHMDQSAVGACLALPVFAIIVPLIILLVIFENCRRDMSKGHRF